MSESSDVPQPRRRKFSLRVRVAIVMVVTVIAAFAIATANNAFGENITGTVACANPDNGGVVGVFVEAERLPRTWPYGLEIQSGFADWRHQGETSVAEFNYWLPFGGAYSVHFGCGSTPSNDWASNNRTGVMSGSGHNWQCNNPPGGTATVVARDCREY